MSAPWIPTAPPQPAADSPAIDYGALAEQLAAFPLDTSSIARRIAVMSKPEILVLVGRIAGEPTGRRALRRLEDVVMFALHGDD